MKRNTGRITSAVKIKEIGMATPVMSLRVPPERQDMVKRFARALKERPELAAELDRRITDASFPKAEPIGPFKDEEAAIGFLRDRLIFAFKPEQIWLFGSRARRDHRPDSDFDIVMVLEDGLPHEMYDYARALEAVSGIGLACEIVPCSLAEFEAGKTVVGTLAETVLREGRLLHKKRQRGHAK